MIQSITRALDIIELLSQQPDRTYLLNEIAKKLDLNIATCANIIKTLVERSYIEQIGPRRGYRIGPIMYYLTSHSSYEKSLIDTASPLIQEFASSLNESVALSVLRNFQRFVLVKAVGQQEIQVNVAYKKEVYETQTGRLMLSYLDRSHLKSFVNKHGLPPADVWKNIKSLQDLQQQLKMIRRKGMIVHKANHLVSIAVPVMKNDHCLAALGVYLPIFRFSKEKKEEIINGLRDIAKKIEAKNN